MFSLSSDEIDDGMCMYICKMQQTKHTAKKRKKKEEQHILKKINAT
jgi:hypothetical protein